MISVPDLNTIEYYHTDTDDNELTLIVEFDYRPGDPGRLNDLPENCYPSEDPEIDITSIRLADASTESSRTHPRYRSRFSFKTPDEIIGNALEQLGADISDGPTFTTWLFTTLDALNQGGFIGPTQRLVGVEISDLLSEKTFSDIEAKCWESRATSRR